MKTLYKTNVAPLAFVLLFPFLVGCSSFSGSGSSSNDPMVVEQQHRVESLKSEVKRAEQETKDAQQRERAAKSRLKAAQDELKVYQNEAKRRSS
ncbi:hypothetical protein ACD591_20005 [Rufibacter glacialis]|uniref:Uncharacterized protein n=1 Tax=Rufibacter glacialis TaxID=1259555 RepID=A0A5M8Q6W1_9BACT|nr:hypothetical protein [Rufibacter glacialis]KAA6430626.1 hypothetical protein FOE74_19315 [Rufibacter glacialis]GGK85265.1 hypothetical protein GCM10011405_36370 [Rufibacter glacialis]